MRVLVGAAMCVRIQVGPTAGMGVNYPLCAPACMRTHAVHVHGVAACTRARVGGGWRVADVSHLCAHGSARTRGSHPTPDLQAQPPLLPRTQDDARASGSRAFGLVSLIHSAAASTAGARAAVFAPLTGAPEGEEAQQPLLPGHSMQQRSGEGSKGVQARVGGQQPVGELVRAVRAPFVHSVFGAGWSSGPLGVRSTLRPSDSQKQHLRRFPTGSHCGVPIPPPRPRIRRGTMRG